MERGFKNFHVLLNSHSLEWQAELFVSSDERQVSAAIESGLKVEFIEGFKPKS